MHKFRKIWLLVFTAVLLPTLYVMSFGPACWIASYRPNVAKVVIALYWPLAKASIILPHKSPGNLLYGFVWRYGRFAEVPPRSIAIDVLEEAVSRLDDFPSLELIDACFGVN